jgi:hypothetical protein
MRAYHYVLQDQYKREYGNEIIRYTDSSDVTCTGRMRYHA